MILANREFITLPEGSRIALSKIYSWEEYKQDGKSNSVIHTVHGFFPTSATVREIDVAFARSSGMDLDEDGHVRNFLINQPMPDNQKGEVS